MYMYTSAANAFYRQNEEKNKTIIPYVNADLKWLSKGRVQHQN